MEDNEKTKVVYTKEMLIKNIAHKCRRDTRIVRLVINALEEDIFDILSSADKDKDVSIRLFEGISFESTYLPYRDKTSNLTGEKIVASERVKAKANITRYYCDKLTTGDR